MRRSLENSKKFCHANLVAQTGSIFVLEIRPEIGKINDGSKTEHLNAVRDLCKSDFARSGKRQTGQGEEVAISNLNDRIIDSSFAMAITTQDAEGQLIGRSKTAEEEGATSPSDANPQDANANWDKSQQPCTYWFKNIHWFADQERIVVFFLKKEGGPVALSFAGSADHLWFK